MSDNYTFQLPSLATFLAMLMLLTSELPTNQAQIFRGTELLAACALKERFTLDEAKTLALTNFLNPNDRFKCFTKCMFEKLKIMENDEFSDSSKFIISEGESLINRDLAKKIYDNCVEQVKQDTGTHDKKKCEKAFKLFMCGRKAVLSYAKNFI